MTSFPVSPRAEVLFSGQRVAVRYGINMVLKSNRKSCVASPFMRFSPYFYFRFSRRRRTVVAFRRFCGALRRKSRPQTVMAFYGLSEMS